MPISWTALPAEIHDKTFSYLSSQDIFRCLTLCKATHARAETALYTNLSVVIHAEGKQLYEDNWKTSWYGRLIWCLQGRKDGAAMARLVPNYNLHIDETKARVIMNDDGSCSRDPDSASTWARAQLVWLLGTCRPIRFSISLAFVDTEWSCPTLYKVDTSRLQYLGLPESRFWQPDAIKLGMFLGAASRTLLEIEVPHLWDYYELDLSKRSKFSSLRKLYCSGECSSDEVCDFISEMGDSGWPGELEVLRVPELDTESRKLLQLACDGAGVTLQVDMEYE